MKPLGHTVPVCASDGDTVYTVLFGHLVSIFQTELSLR